ncbi:MAG: nicotinate-nucleotide--dimethylbenzimidazole phosphoribosyltransferase [Flavonifractor plautii]
MSTGVPVCAMARSPGRRWAVDIGTAVPLTGARIVQRCVRRGTADMTQGPSGAGEAVQAVAGVEIARELCAGGVRLLATGEMGIGNTTTSSAVAAVLLGQEPVVMTGRGAGLSDAGLQKKIHAIETAVAVNRPDPADVLDVLHKVGGLDIAGLAGVFLGGALCHAGAGGRVHLPWPPWWPPGCARPVRTTCWAPTRREPASRLVLSELGLRPFSTPGCVWARALGPWPSCPAGYGAGGLPGDGHLEDTNIEAYQPLAGGRPPMDTAASQIFI